MFLKLRYLKESTAKFCCESCDYTFKTKNKLEEHTQEKHTEKENEDTIVGENDSSTVEISDKTDTNVTKSDEKVFNCDECNYKSSSEHGMKIQKTKKHVQRCQYCNQIFPNAVEKSNHLVGCDAMTAY